MALGMLLDMTEAAHGDRVLVGSLADGLTGQELAGRARRGGTEIHRRGASHVVFVGVNSPAVPVTALACGLAGVPFTPLNYRLSRESLGELISRLDAPLLVVEPSYLDTIGAPAHAVGVLTTPEWSEVCTTTEVCELPEVDDQQTSVMLFTSGTTSAPKGVLLRHSHLVSYVLQTVEFSSADAADAALIAVPPYHVAGVGTILTNLYAGRRMTYLSDFTAVGWLRTVAAEQVTSAMVVPTMLARIVEHLEAESDDLPSLRAIAYGGARLPRPVLEKALTVFPNVGFTNAYGLTETSSTIAVLGPEDHRSAAASEDPAVRSRLGAAGQFVPGVEGQIRDPDGRPVPTGQIGELWVRGAQISGEYSGTGSVLDAAGWFPTRDHALLDADGYLFIEGRSDDTIIRGGENIAPTEIEDVLATHPYISDVAVFGIPDDEWGQRIAAALVLRDGAPDDAESYRDWVRARLRSSRTPDQIMFVRELPYTPTGKLLRRELAAAQLLRVEESS